MEINNGKLTYGKYNRILGFLFGNRGGSDRGHTGGDGGGDGGGGGEWSPPVNKPH